MDRNGTTSRSGRDTYMAIVLCVLVGLPLFVFLNVLTGGLFVLILATAAGVAVLGAFHYFLWGRSFTREISANQEQTSNSEEMTVREWPYEDPFERREIRL